MFRQQNFEFKSKKKSSHLHPWTFWYRNHLKENLKQNEISRSEMTNKKIGERLEWKEPRNSFDTLPANRSNNYCERLLLSSSLPSKAFFFSLRFPDHNSHDSFLFWWIFYLSIQSLAFYASLLLPFFFYKDPNTVFIYTMAANKNQSNWILWVFDLIYELSDSWARFLVCYVSGFISQEKSLKNSLNIN